MTTNRKKFFQKYQIPEKASLSLTDISALTDIPREALQVVYDRGIGAWKSNPSSVRLKNGQKNPDTFAFPREFRMGKEQWSWGRIYAFAMKSPKVYFGSDDDVRRAYGLS
jgi:hypothetical protein